MKTKPLATLFALASCLSASTITGLHSTGIDNGTGGDANYTLVVAPFFSNYGSTPTIIYNAAEIVPQTGDASWIPNQPGSAWIGPASQQTGSVMAPGLYAYQTTFNLELDSAPFILSGLWAADGVGLDILVNGILTSSHTIQPTPGTTAGSYTAFSQFSIDCGECFINGANTLTFAVWNGSMESGLYVTFPEATVRGNTPEPGTFFLIGAALTMLGYRKWRKQ